MKSWSFSDILLDAEPLKSGTVLGVMNGKNCTGVWSVIGAGTSFFVLFLGVKQENDLFE